MRVRKEGEFYIGTHITGPTHNLLRMKVQSIPNLMPLMKVLPATGQCTHGPPLDADETLGWIRVGIARANDELGTVYDVAKAEVIEHDNRCPEVYAELARRIILIVHGDVAI